MAACPSCGRALATGARSCVYCAQGTSFKRREELQVPKGALPKRRGGFPWRTFFLALLILAGVGAYLQPGIRVKVDSIVRSLLAKVQ